MWSRDVVINDREQAKLPEDIEGIMQQIKDLSFDKRKTLYSALKYRENERRKANPECLFWDKDAILEDLIQNRVTKESANVMWYKWMKITIDLPKIKGFEWFKRSYFVSYPITVHDFQKNPSLEQKSCSTEEICSLVQKINEYAKAFWIENDWDMDYQENMGNEDYWCSIAWAVLKNITSLDGAYFLKDWMIWFCCWPHCSFGNLDKWATERDIYSLFLKLPN